MAAFGNSPPTSILYHQSFNDPDLFDVAPKLSADLSQHSYMQQEMTSDYARCMHYAGYRWQRQLMSNFWPNAYYTLRNKIVEGNRKLVFSASKKWCKGYSDSVKIQEYASEGNLVLLKAVDSFDPWRNIRFSTYAMTCIMRHFSRHKDKDKRDLLSETVSIASFIDDSPVVALDRSDTYKIDRLERIQVFLDPDHELLTEREKIVINTHYFHKEKDKRTLRGASTIIGLSRERIRQIEEKAFGKIRRALKD
jgi:RNA polymerase sigma factor (sigma-70 family)